MILTKDQLIQSVVELAKKVCAEEGVEYEAFIADISQAMDKQLGVK